MRIKKMGVMKLAAVIKKSFLYVVLVASITIVTLSSAFSILHTSAASRRSLSKCSSHRYHRVNDQVDMRGKWDSSSNRPIFPSLVLPLLLSFIIAVLPAQATSDTAVNAAKIFNNNYADPLHPLCERKIEVAKDGTTFHYSGTAVGRLTSKSDDDPTVVLRGCSQAEIKQYTLRQDSFDGLVLDGGRRISLETGDGIIHKGVWEEAKNTATVDTTNLDFENVDGIRWNDGNKWIVQSQSMVQKNALGKNVVIKKPISTVIGEFVIFSYITFSGLAGVKGIVDAYKRRKQ